MGLFKSSTAKAAETWAFWTERDPDLWDREKPDWRARRAAKARLAAKQARVRGGKK